MPNFAGSKTQRADIYMQGFSPRIHPRQACSLDCIAKLRFAFHPALPARQLRQTFCSIQHVLFRRHPANTFQARFLTEHYTLRPPLPTSRRQPVTAFRRISFHTNPHSLTPVSNLHSDLTGKRIHSLILFSFFSFFFFISLCTKKRKPAKPISISFSCNPKFSPNLVQASPSQSLSLLFSPSNQYVLPHRPRSGHT